MKRLPLILILLGLLATLFPPSLAQKTPKGKKEVLLPQPTASQPITDLTNVGEAKKAQKTPTTSAPATQAPPASSATPVSASGFIAVPPAPSQETGVASSVVSSSALEAGTGVAEMRQSSGPVYDEIPALTAEQMEQRMRGQFEKVNRPVFAPQGDSRKILDKPDDPPTEVNRPTTEIMRADTLKQRERVGQSAAGAPLAPNDFIYGAVRDVPTTAAVSRYVIHEPSVGSMGDTLFYTGNVFAARSADGGRTFTYVSPYSTFPSINGGFCCDQLADFAPNQNMMLWALQYYSDDNSGTLRLARAVGPTAVLNNQWSYYDFNPQMFGFSSGNWMDYPNMVVGSTFLYMASNVFDNNDRFTGSVVWRIPLSQLAAGGNINFSYLRTQDFSPRLTEGARTAMYWAVHNSSSQVKIFRWGDSDTQITRNEVNINPYTYLSRDGVAVSPDGTNWAARCDSRIMGGWVANGVVGFMWGAKQNSQRPFPYTIIARFSESSRALISQHDIWNPQFAWLYPTASVNSAGNLAGMLMFGGGPHYPGSNIWISDDVQGGFNPLALYGATESNRGPTRNQWGDYHTVHPHKDSPNTWVGATYYIQNGGDNSNAIPRYLWFGRERDFSCTFTISPTSQNFTSAGGNGSVSITASTTTCNRTAVSNASWISITSGATGTGSGTVTYSVAANSTSAQRTGTLTVAGRTFTVTQAGSTCTFGLSPTSVSVGAAGLTSNVSVTTSATGCAWAAVSNVSWINVNSGASGTGNGTVNYTVAANSSTATRTGTLTIAGLTFTVTQAAGSGGGNCSPVAISFGQTANGTLQNTDCVLNDGSFYDTYTFSGTAGQSVTIYMSSSSFDTYLFLLAPDGSVLASDDDGGGGTNSRIPAGTGGFTLPTTGTYRIFANSFAPNVTGSYALQLKLNVTCTQTPISFGQTANGTLQNTDCVLNDGSFYDTYTFSGTAGQSVTIYMSSSSFDTYLFLLAPDGSLLDFDDDGGGGTNSRIPAGTGGFTLPAGGTYTILANSYFPNVTGNYALTLSRSYGSLKGVYVGQSGDFDGDGRDDRAVWRVAAGAWFVVNSATNSVTSRGWGTAGDIPVVADYDGDRRADLAVWRPDSGAWFIINSATNSVTARGWGTAGDIPVPGDYDGDGRADLAVWRPDSGAWFIINSATNGVTARGWGSGEDIPVPGDYDGDGRTDLAIWRPSAGAWFIINSSTGAVTARGWGTAGDIPVPGDYDGDGRADLAVWRPDSGAWFIINSATNSVTARGWGTAGDTPVPSDYDGDRRDDLAVWRGPSGAWFIINSATNVAIAPGWGSEELGDVPVTPTLVRK